METKSQKRLFNITNRLVSSNVCPRKVTSRRKQWIAVNSGNDRNSVSVHEVSTVDGEEKTSEYSRDDSFTYFKQMHEFRIDFAECGDPDALESDDNYENLALKEWIRKPELLLVASYGRDKVTQIEDKDGKMIWHVQLPSAKVFSWEVTPSFDINAEIEEDGVIFTSSSIQLSGAGIPKSIHQTKIEFSMFSHLYLSESNLDSPILSMVAENSLELGLKLPNRLCKLPGVRQTGNRIVKVILATVDKSAKKKLRKSFQEWNENVT